MEAEAESRGCKVDVRLVLCYRASWGRGRLYCQLAWPQCCEYCVLHSLAMAVLSHWLGSALSVQLQERGPWRTAGHQCVALLGAHDP